MTTLTKKLTIAAAVAGMLAATPAMANSYRHSSQAGPMASEGYVVGNAGYDAYAQSSYGWGNGADSNLGFGAYAAAPDSTLMAPGPGVISYDRYAGWDPDPAIRLMLKRDTNGKNAP